MLSLRLILIQNLIDQKNKSMNFCVDMEGMEEYFETNVKSEVESDVEL